MINGKIINEKYLTECVSLQLATASIIGDWESYCGSLPVTILFDNLTNFADILDISSEHFVLDDLVSFLNKKRTMFTNVDKDKEINAGSSVMLVE